MFGGENDIGNAENRIHTGRENFEFVAAFTFEFNFAANRFSDPVALHQLCLFRPVYLVKTLQKLFGILRDFKEPLRKILFDHRRTAAFAATVKDLFVCQNRIAA